jgi:pachytene checkpoint protein 2
MWTTQGRCPQTHRPNNNHNQLQFDEFERRQTDRKVLSQHGYRDGQQTHYTSFTRILTTIHNFAGAIDEAFLSRADLVVTIDLPTPDACKAILLDTLDRLAKVFPRVAALRATPQIGKAAAQAVGLDARRIRKAVLAALADSKQIAANPESLTADAVLAAVQAAQAERTNMEKCR